MTHLVSDERESPKKLKARTFRQKKVSLETESIASGIDGFKKSHN